jgi:hypothetical protein
MGDAIDCGVWKGVGFSEGLRPILQSKAFVFTITDRVSWLRHGKRWLGLCWGDHSDNY